MASERTTDAPRELSREEIERHLKRYAQWIACGGMPMRNEDERIKLCSLTMAAALLDERQAHAELRARIEELEPDLSRADNWSRPDSVLSYRDRFKPLQQATQALITKIRALTAPKGNTHG